MRRRRANPAQPHVHVNPYAATLAAVGVKDRGDPPPPPPPPEQVRLFVYRNMNAGASLELIVQLDEAVAAGEQRPPYGRLLLDRTYSAICRELASAARLPEHAQETLRAQATQRLRRDLTLLRARMSRANITDLDYARLDARVTAKESLLGEIEGTKQLQVNVKVDMDLRVRSAAMRVIGDMSADDFAEMGRRYIDAHGSAAE